MKNRPYPAHSYKGGIGIPVLAIWLLAGPQTTPPQIARIVAIIIGAFLYPLLFILFVCLPFKSALAKKLNELNSVPVP